MAQAYPLRCQGVYTGGMLLSPHFSLRELTQSQTAARLGIINQPGPKELEALKLVCTQILEPVRAQFHVPIFPSSGYRCPALNAAIGGSAKSQHCQGAAVDFEVAGLSPRSLVLWIQSNLTYDQLILEFPLPKDVNAGWVHVSRVKGGNRRQSLTKTRSGISSGFPAF